MLTSAGVCKAPGPEFRYESSTSSGANQRREWAMAKESVVVAVPPGSETAATPPALMPFFHHHWLGLIAGAVLCGGTDGLRCVRKQSAARKISQ